MFPSRNQFFVIDVQIMVSGNHKYEIRDHEFVFATMTLYTDIVNLVRKSRRFRLGEPIRMSLEWSLCPAYDNEPCSLFPKQFIYVLQLLNSAKD